ncbi:MAG: hypothetical protein A2085_10740 [Gemmatimonadetes bacterium GWC2_71_10]|nr:MAG: hypothetical protein A2085_10740 [Gemmatimonadetes bacterium GWC2_71_10]
MRWCRGPEPPASMRMVSTLSPSASPCTSNFIAAEFTVASKVRSRSVRVRLKTVDKPICCVLPSALMAMTVLDWTVMPAGVVSVEFEM